MKKYLFPFLVLLMFTGVSKADNPTPRKWLLVTTSESAPNAYPVSVMIDGTSVNCTGVNPDNPNLYPIGYSSQHPNDPSGNSTQGACWNPLGYTFNAITPDCGIGSHWTVAAASLASYGFTDISRMTNSSGSPEDLQPPLVDVKSITVACSNKTYTTTVTNEDNSVFVFTASADSDPMTGTFTSSNGSSHNDHGNFKMWNDIATPTGSYTGQFDHIVPANGVALQSGVGDNVIVNFGNPTLSSNFALTNTITLTNSGPIGSDSNICFLANGVPFTSSDPAAQNLNGIPSANFVSGSLTVVNLGDNHGTVITLYVNPGTDQEGVYGLNSNPDSNKDEFMSFTVWSTGGAVLPSCYYSTGYDAPFHRMAVWQHNRSNRAGFKFLNR